jgi:hypothetical protein
VSSITYGLPTSQLWIDRDARVTVLTQCSEVCVAYLYLSLPFIWPPDSTKAGHLNRLLACLILQISPYTVAFLVVPAM